MKGLPEDRAVQFARYIIEAGATVRETAKEFHISKSTVHKDIQERLPLLNYPLYREVRVVLDRNKEERHLRGGEATLCHAGDSRAYLCRGGKLTQLTHDHSYVQELVDCGTITEEEAEHHPQKNIITRALGVDYRLEPEVTSVQLQAKDLLLLCSDGLTNMVPVEQMEQLLAQGPFYDLPDRLVDAANENGGSDNITALLLAVEPTEVHHG